MLEIGAGERRLNKADLATERRLHPVFRINLGRDLRFYQAFCHLQAVIQILQGFSPLIIATIRLPKLMYHVQRHNPL